MLYSGLYLGFLVCQLLVILVCMAVRAFPKSLPAMLRSQPNSAWLPTGAGEAGTSYSSDSEAAAELSSPATRTVSQGLAELATLGSSPDSSMLDSNPIIGRKASDAASWSSALESIGALCMDICVLYCAGEIGSQ